MTQNVNQAESDIRRYKETMDEIHPGLNAASKALSPLGLGVWFLLSVPLAVSALQGLPVTGIFETTSGVLLAASAVLSGFIALLLVVTNFVRKAGAQKLLLATMALGTILVFVDISAAVTMPQREMETAVLQSFRLGVVLHVLLLLVLFLHVAAQALINEQALLNEGPLIESE